jgi:hypothetical protein
VIFTSINLCVASQRVFILVYFVIDSVRKILPGVKRPEREADHSPPSKAGVKECVELYLHSPIRLHGVVLS